MNLAVFLMGSVHAIPEDVLSLLFEMCSARDVAALSILTRGVAHELREGPCPAWKLAARAMLRNLCVPLLASTSPPALRKVLTVPPATPTFSPQPASAAPLW